MDKIRIGVICPSEIASRRFLPALKKYGGGEYVGIAHAAADEWLGDGAPSKAVLAAEGEKAAAFQREHGGRLFASYKELLAAPEVDAVYIPLPPALHYEWGKKALEHGKHLLLEKPFTTRLEDTEALLGLAAERGLAVHENYMFLYHGQLQAVKDIIASGELGEVRLYRAAFGFPKRGEGDFRYDKALGGGALLDCGGYPLRLALELLGEGARVTQARLCQPPGCQVDLYGSAVLEDAAGGCAQLAFGMDNSYKCELEVWGSRGTLLAPRIFTAPAGFAPQLLLQKGGEQQILRLEPDDSFFKSIEAFARRIAAGGGGAAEIVRQAGLQQAVRRLSEDERV